MDNKQAAQNSYEINLDSLNKKISSQKNSWNNWMSVIWKVNYDENYENIDLRNIWNLNNNRKKWRSRSAWVIFLLFLIILFCATWFMFYKYDKYIIDYWNWIEDSTNKIVETYEKAKEKFGKTKEKVYGLIWKSYIYEEPITTIKLDDENWKETLKQLINSEKSYIYKKETLKKSTNEFFNSVIRSANHLDETKKHLSSFWFFSDKLTNIISDNESISLIQESLTAIESIKFSSAISVFSKLDTFITSIYKETWLEKDTILDKINEITKRWEQDINLYIKNCRLNASELDFQCNNIWDFDRYYALTEETWFDTRFFKYLMQFVHEKLEQTEIPSFTISFNWFNPDSNEMTFDIEINTFKEDEIELAKNWILSPHSFILNNLINNLRLSRVIISEFIKIESITVNQVIKTFWTTEFIVNSSQHSFTVPIKNENQIEIDDFSY